MTLRVISRSEWGARPYTNPPADNSIGRSSVCFLHHSEFPTLPASATRAQEVARMRDIEAVHMDENGWSAIGYSYVAFPSGRVYTGRGFSHVPAAQAGWNTGHGAVCFDGDYETSRTTWAARRSVVYLLRQRFSRGGAVGVHRDVNQTSCPGRYVASVAGRIAFLAGLRRY